MNSAEELSRVSGQVFQDLKSSAQSQCGVTSAPVPPPKSLGAGLCVGGEIPGADGLSGGVRTVVFRGGSVRDICASVRVIRTVGFLRWRRLIRGRTARSRRLVTTFRGGGVATVAAWSTGRPTGFSATGKEPCRTVLTCHPLLRRVQRGQRLRRWPVGTLLTCWCQTGVRRWQWLGCGLARGLSNGSSRR